MRTANNRRAERAGMTLIEVMVALVILSGSLIAMGNFMGKFTETQKFASLRQDEIDIATDLIDSVEHASSYAAIPGFAGTASETRDNASFSRTTTVTQVGGAATSTVNYYLITTAVTTTALTPSGNATVTKTIAIRQF
jgi:prepilin-type N-terminal cleavage/methylation domain-containing protein